MCSRWLSFITVVASVSVGSWIGSAQQPVRLDGDALRNAWRTGQWVSYGNDPAERRYSPLDQIDRSNVNRLGLAWTAETGEGGGNQEATPLAWNGVLYGVTNWSIVFAMDVRTGNDSGATTPR